jgi:hypothetical protein
MISGDQNGSQVVDQLRLIDCESFNGCYDLMQLVILVRLRLLGAEYIFVCAFYLSVLYPFAVSLGGAVTVWYARLCATKVIAECYFCRLLFYTRLKTIDHLVFTLNYVEE